MSFNPFKKITGAMAGLAAKMPGKGIFRKGTKAAAIVSSVALLGKLGHMLYRKVDKKVGESVAAGKQGAIAQIRAMVNKSLEKFIFECILRWVLYILLIVLAFITAKTLGLPKDILVSLVILGIYVFYVIKFCHILRWYLSFYRDNGRIYNPLRLIRAYLHKAVLDQVQSVKKGLPLHERLAMNFFGPASDKLASDITEGSLESSELRKEAITRIGMWACGWLIYMLVYERFFLFVTGVDFQAFWEPFLWPFRVLLGLFS